MSEAELITVNGKTLDEVIKELQENYSLVGRENELKMCLAAKLAERHLLLEGDVGVGKTTIAHSIANYFSQNLERVDGDDRYSAARLVGHFDPPMVVERGYNWDGRGWLPCRGNTHEHNPIDDCRGVVPNSAVA